MYLILPLFLNPVARKKVKSILEHNLPKGIVSEEISYLTAEYKGNGIWRVYVRIKDKKAADDYFNPNNDYWSHRTNGWIYFDINKGRINMAGFSKKLTP
jgi:hypothetical protein